MIAFTGPLLGHDNEPTYAIIDTNKVYFIIDGLAFPLTEEAMEDDLEEDLCKFTL